MKSYCFFILPRPLHALEDAVNNLKIPYTRFFDIDIDAREENIDLFKNVQKM